MTREELREDLASSTRTVMLDAVKIHALSAALSQIRELSTGWQHGNEGVHLLRINDIASAALAAGTWMG